MYIIIKSERHIPKESVINILNSEDIADSKKWMMDYIKSQKTSYEMCPNLKYTKNVTYQILETENECILVKKYDLLEKGYVYNQYTSKMDTLTMLKCLKYEYNGDEESIRSLMDINRSVLKQLDKDALYEILIGIVDQISSKAMWTRKEVTHVVSNVLRTVKKQVYNTITKQIKRLEKKNEIKKEEVPKINRGNCGLEAIRKSKLE